ncbi:MAG: tryptophanase [Deltaproteobacteria bacterium]|nr:tryptophanase [Deltaproteobacteria bacterium]
MKTIIEPFRVKVVEPIRMTSRAEREAIVAAAKYNLFQVRAEDVIVDLLTDSGTSAMSAAQWGALFQGDESYAGARSFYRFQAVIRELTGFEHIIPTHQGRAAERILFSVMAGPGKVVPNNTHFDTTRANVEAVGAVALDLPCEEARDLGSQAPFKGDVDLAGLARCLEENPGRVPLVMVTVTNNSGGGQPVSLANLRAVRELCTKHGVPLYLDAARFAENAYLIKLREPGQAGRSAREIAREMFRLCDGATMSAKKDALVNIGGFVATNDGDVAAQMRNVLILTEGFPTYGGMAGRDLEAIAVGLDEILDEDYLNYRFASTRYLGQHLTEMGIPLMQPVGGHAIYIDARRMLPHIPPLEYPGQSLAVATYVEGGVRSVEVGSVMFGRRDEATGAETAAPRDLVRLAIPRRVYTQSHIDYVVEVMQEVHRRKEFLRGMRIAWQPPALRHFSAHFEPLT